MGKSQIELIISGELLLPSEGKTYNGFGDEVRSKNVMTKKITSVKIGHRTKKIVRREQKMEAQINSISQNCGNLQKYIEKSAQKTKANKFKAMRGK